MRATLRNTFGMAAILGFVETEHTSRLISRRQASLIALPDSDKERVLVIMNIINATPTVEYERY